MKKKETSREPVGRHFLLDFKECNAGVLDDIKKIEEILLNAAKAAKATIIESRFHRFNPFGVSGVVVIAESHLTIHTWPEYHYAAVDIFTCGEILQASDATDYLTRHLESKKMEKLELKRGPFQGLLNDSMSAHLGYDSAGNRFTVSKSLRTSPVSTQE